MDLKKDKRILRFRRPLRPNIGLIIFFVIFAYMVASVVSFITSHRTEAYLVRMGSLSENAFYRGIVLRRETVATSAYSGNVYYYNREGDRIPVGGLLYSVDEGGALTEYLAELSEEQKTSDDTLAALRAEAASFAGSFDPAYFSTVYSFRSTVMTAAQKIANEKILNKLDKADKESVHRHRSKATGEVAYTVDGFEGKTFEDLTAEDLDATGYKRVTLENGRRVEKDEAVCRIVTSENWQIAILVDSQETAERLVKDNYVKVRFLRSGTEIWGSVTSRSDEEGNHFVLLSFSQGMEEFITERYLDIEIVTEEETGLKVPNTAITRGSFFLVPADYMTTGTGGQTGVLLEVYDDNGGKTTRFVPAAAYSEVGDVVYLSDNVLRAGEILDKRDSLEQFTLGEQAELVGVYYINKGYPDFRQVEIVYQNEEFAIVKPDAVFGLQEYDYIVLHADSIDFDQGGR